MILCCDCISSPLEKVFFCFVHPVSMPPRPLIMMKVSTTFVWCNTQQVVAVWGKELAPGVIERARADGRARSNPFDWNEWQFCIVVGGWA